jgi:hypothetical protein
MPNDRTRDDDTPGDAAAAPSSERLRGRAATPLFADTLRPPAGDAVPPPPSTSFGSPATPHFDDVDDLWDDDAPESDLTPSERRKTAEERANARKEKSRKRAERRKSRSAAAAAKQKQKQKKQRNRDAPSASAESSDPDSSIHFAASSHAPRARTRDWMTAAVVIAVVLSVALAVAALLARTS